MSKKAILFGLSVALSAVACIGAEPLKQRSAFYPAQQVSVIRSNLQVLPNGAELKAQALQKADYWLRLSDDEVWSLMFGPSIRRSWMVWSNGKCPACTNDVVMYKWIIKPKEHPWKVRCPHCKEFFPKNDFAAFYKSGLDAKGVFDPKLANRDLLFNAEHPNPEDPLRSFGVDDGEGFVRGDERWRFIGAYLVYGQFKQLVRDGIQALAEAWVLTGDTNCARKAGILLDRVADLYPGFDYARQGFVYEKQGPDGYVSVWHDACEETREMVLAYDQVFEALGTDALLVQFLSEKARKHGLENSKATFADIQRNIEDRILRDALNSTGKMHSNFPRREIAYTTIKAVIGWPENKAEVEKYIDGYVAQATAVDGVTGEKGLAGYASYTIVGLASLLGEFSQADTAFLKAMLDRLPSLRQTWRFHIDTMCLDRFYPTSGDSGTYAQPIDRYVGASFVKLTTPQLGPSMFTFFHQLYEATGDPAYIQVLYRENGDSVEELPHDLRAQNPEKIRRDTERVIAEHGKRPGLRSVHKPAWHFAILRSGQGEHARAAWLDYDAGGAHGHFDAMTIGLFARGMDLLPDFGYPPVQHGGWTTPQVAWYLSPAAHNTVTVDGQSQRTGAGQCDLFADGERLHIVRASAPNLIDIQQFERTVALVDVSDKDFYLLDLFWVRSGGLHTKFVYGPRTRMDVPGLNLAPTEPYGRGAMMRSFKTDTNPPQSWSASWALETGESQKPNGFMRYTDLTVGASAGTAEANVMPYNHERPEGFWIPSLVIQRTGKAPLASCFAGVFEPGEERPLIEGAERLAVFHGANECTNECVAIQLRMRTGVEDVVISANAPHRALESTVEAGTTTLVFMGDTCLVRIRNGKPKDVSVVRASILQAGNATMRFDSSKDLIEQPWSGTK